MDYKGHYSLAITMLSGFIGRSIKYCSMRHFHKYAGEFIYEDFMMELWNNFTDSCFVLF